MNTYGKAMWLVPILLTTGCAGSASHRVEAEYQARDERLSCTEIEAEIDKAQKVIDGVNADKNDLTGADVVDGLLWFPFNLIAKDANYNEAIDAGSRRIARMSALRAKKGCPAPS